MSLLTLVLGALLLGGAVASVTLRHLVHCALALLVALGALAGLYLDLGAQFLGLAQVLVYIGAVGVVLVFAILLTRGGGAEVHARTTSWWAVALGIGGLLAVLLISSIVRSPSIDQFMRNDEKPLVKDLGGRLMTDAVIPLEMMGLLLTSALVGAVVIAMPEPKKAVPPEPRQ